ncbi:MAG: hypothetical protein OXI55_06130, partial [Gammaproteobacteria bacterium]|nr:hypothetical protein [Gammaproteobacteria bacterium]
AARLRGAGPMSADGDRRDRPQDVTRPVTTPPAPLGGGGVPVVTGRRCGLRASGGKRSGNKKAGAGVVTRC